MSAPKTLTTERLTLTALSDADRPAMRAFYQSPRRIASMGAVAPEEVERRIDTFIAQWRALGFGRYVMRAGDRVDDCVVGATGLSRHEDNPETELSWYIWSDAAEGQGFASEGARAVRAMAYDQLGLPPLVSFIAPQNTRSIALAARLGAVPEPGETGVTYLPDHRIYRHPGPAAGGQL